MINVLVYTVCSWSEFVSFEQGSHHPRLVRVRPKKQIWSWIHPTAENKVVYVWISYLIKMLIRAEAEQRVRNILLFGLYQRIILELLLELNN